MKEKDMKRKELTLKDRKDLQLEMLEEIDCFCKKNNYKYALSCGTLIGAIRHGGYIPWDDDVDITMLFSDIISFRENFKSNNLEYCDVETEQYYGHLFPRIYSKKTYSKLGFHKCKGVFIDLYPIIECSNNINEINKLLTKGNCLRNKVVNYSKLYYRIIKYTPFSYLPCYSKAMKDYYSYMINEIQSKGGGNYYQMGGALIGKANNFYRNLWPFNPLEELIDWRFEGGNFLIPSRYDEFLRVRYGDYMELPPDSQRHPYHGGTYFWR